jgi:C-5 cytosine-specific DNA methylase
METTSVIDLTIYDDRQLRMGDFIPHVPQVQPALRCTKLPPPPSTAKKRKHVHVLTHNNTKLKGCKSPGAIVLDDSEDAVTVIDRAFPIAELRRRASRLEVLAQPIQIVDDEDGELDHLISHVDKFERRLSDSITSDVSLTDIELRRWLRNVQLEGENSREAELNQRTELSTFRGVNFTCAPGKGVQLHDGSFLRIKTVTRNGKGQVFVAGIHLVRQNFLGLKMPKRRGEVVWIRKSSTDRDVHELYEVNVDQVEKNREIVFTNQQFPAVSSRTDQDSLRDAQQDVELGPLFCRWKMTAVLKDHVTAEEAIEHLQHEDADDKTRPTNFGDIANTRIEDNCLRFSWRKTVTVVGGSHVVTQEVANLDGGVVELTELQSYTFGDAFCGAGGASRGALDAGMCVRWGFDMDEQAITSYSLNFESGGTSCKHQAVHEFLQSIRLSPPFVDVLHISPPCQPFSHAHTVPSPQRDEINQAALFSVWHLVETLKPRAVTIEETDALMSRYQEWFSALINIFINLGYSVRWAALHCGKYGVPQIRKRLFIIASG